MAIKITSDSTCDLAKELLEKHDIELFPLYITLGGKTLRDGVEITPDDIFAHVAAGGALASTAAVTPNDYETRFAQLSREYDAVIHINISSDFSACHQNARIAAENYKNVYVVDSRNLSSGHGHVVVEAALRAEAGMKAEDIVKELETRTLCQTLTQALYSIGLITWQRAAAAQRSPCSARTYCS